jgi:hypothetical protein
MNEQFIIKGSEHHESLTIHSYSLSLSITTHTHTHKITPITYLNKVSDLVARSEQLKWCEPSNLEIGCSHTYLTQCSVSMMFVWFSSQEKRMKRERVERQYTH